MNEPKTYSGRMMLEKVARPPTFEATFTAEFLREFIVNVEREATHLLVRRVEDLARYWDGAGGDYPAAAQQIRAAIANEAT